MDYYFFRRNLYTIQFIFEYQGQLNGSRLAKALSLTAEVIPAVGFRRSLRKRWLSRVAGEQSIQISNEGN